MIVTEIDVDDSLEMNKLASVLTQATWSRRVVPETDLEYFVTKAEDSSFDVRIIDHGKCESYPGFIATG